MLDVALSNNYQLSPSLGADVCNKILYHVKSWHTVSFNMNQDVVTVALWLLVSTDTKCSNDIMQQRVKLT